jgi:hypothetical protein
VFEHGHKQFEAADMASDAFVSSSKSGMLRLKSVAQDRDETNIDEIDAAYCSSVSASFCGMDSKVSACARQIGKIGNRVQQRF